MYDASTCHIYLQIQEILSKQNKNPTSPRKKNDITLHIKSYLIVYRSGIGFFLNNFSYRFESK